MSRVVLASSPLVGPSAMDALGGILAENGFEVTIPDVPADLGDFTESVAAAVGPDTTVVGYSAAGPPLFTLAALAAPAALVFLDARLPADGIAPDAEPQFAELLDALPSDDGLLPPWPNWWPDDVMVSLIPDVHARATFRSSCPRIHRSTFSEPIPAPAFAGPCGFVGFGDGYAADAAESRRRGWPTTVIEGAHHLWPVVEPRGAAVALAGMIRRLRR